MELFIENLQNNINVDNKSLNFITNHNKNQIELTEKESIHVKKGSGNYNCQYNCYFVIEFDNTTAWVWSKDINLKVTIGSLDGSIKTLKLIDSLEDIDHDQRNVICLTKEMSKPIKNGETIEIKGLKYNTKLLFFLNKNDTISYEFDVMNLNTIDYKTYYHINYLDLLKELITDDKNKIELLKLKEKLSIHKENTKKKKELIETYKLSDNINAKLINELRLKNELLNQQIKYLKLQEDKIMKANIKAKNNDFKIINNLKSENNLLSEELQKFKNNNERITEENKNLTKNNNLLQFDMADLEYENDKLTSDLNEQKQKLKNSENKDLEKEISKNTIKKLYDENKKLYDENKKINNNIINLKLKNDNLIKNNYNLTQKDKKIQKNLQSSKIKLNKYMKECDDRKNTFNLFKINIKNQFDNEKRKNPNTRKELSKIYKNINKKFIL